MMHEAYHGTSTGWQTRCMEREGWLSPPEVVRHLDSPLLSIARKCILQDEHQRPTARAVRTLILEASQRLQQQERQAWAAA